MHVNANATTLQDGACSVLLADPHLVTAQSVASFLRDKGSYRTRGVANLAEALEAGANEKFDFLLYDCGLQGCFGLESLRSLLSAFPETSVVLFGDCTDGKFLTAALKMGLKGYIPKSMPLDSLLPTMELLKAGESFVPVEIWRKLLHSEEPAQKREPLLDTAQLDLLKLVQKGLSNKEIGVRICQSENAVKMKLRFVYRKLAARSRMIAIKNAKELGELD